MTPKEIKARSDAIYEWLLDWKIICGKWDIDPNAPVEIVSAKLNTDPNRARGIRFAGFFDSSASETEPLIVDESVSSVPNPVPGG